MPMDSRLHVSLPYRMLAEQGGFLLARRLQPEIAFKGPDLDEVDLAELLERWGAAFRAAGLAVAVHAPFMDLNPGAVEPLVREVTALRLNQALDAAQRLGARRLVVHPGYDRWRYAGNEDLWVEQSLGFWPPLIRRAADAGVVLALENVFEDAPGNLEKLLAAIDSPWFGHCFDVGHWHLFCRERISLADWFQRFSRHLVHLHVHDNLGEGDDHLPIGEGLIPFAEFFALVRRHAPQATLTLEAHDPESLLRALLAVRPFLVPC
ncbi:sugar phosphate isomerase/epimerase family protein [Geoalkalibacter sp.]|uniref:sugar phosphate isomerase/epimerase family protein n=1 Tax=Geoalkalibacter sp. TaxID=3041440 RepID=UPI00272E20C9|nr:sugar phosphate isomerase/epimerase family protein [Geoalkalibacter sp.]